MRPASKIGIHVTSIFLAVLLFSTSIMAQAQSGWNTSTQTAQNASDASAAIADAQRDADMDANGALWFIAGCLGSWIGLVLAYALEPDPPVTRLLGKSETYVANYSDEYKKDVKGDRTKMAWIGCGAAVLFYVVYIAVAISVASNQTTINN